VEPSTTMTPQQDDKCNPVSGNLARSGRKPAVLPVQADRVPLALRDVPRWVLWRYQWAGEKWAKMPINQLGRRIDVHQAENQRAFRTVLEQHRTGCGDGVGFVITAGDGFIGIDLDDCFEENRQLQPWAQEIIRRAGTYAEVSPSGRGIRIIGRGTKPKWAGSRKTVEGRHVEIYDARQYVTVTGRHLEGTPTEVLDTQELVDALCQELWPERARKADAKAEPRSEPEAPRRGRQAGGASWLTDEQVIEKAFNGKHGDRFRRLWAGDTSGHNNDDSAADLALCNALNFYCRGDQAQMDRLFRRSGLMRPKWDERRGDRSYGRMTLDKACENRTYYEP
jgi:putative DNA primase/helicase